MHGWNLVLLIVGILIVSTAVSLGLGRRFAKMSDESYLLPDHDQDEPSY